MSFGQSVSSCFRNYVNFNGRAPRSEYWYFQLFQALCVLGIFVVLAVIGGLGGSSDNGGSAAGGAFGALFMLYLLGTFLPALAVTIRRLHDTDRSGWWYLIAFLPFGGIVLFVFFLMKGTEGENEYGPDPFGVPSAASVFS